MLAKLSSVSDCGPSDRAASGFGWTSTISPCAPTASDASASGLTRYHLPVPWLGSATTGQVAQPLHDRDGGQVEGVADHRLEGADAALAEDDLEVLLGHDVLGGVQPLVDRAGHAALEHDRLLGAAGLLQQREVLHVAGADLEDVGVARRRGRRRPAPSPR